MAVLADVIGRDTLANRPASGSTAELFYATDEAKLYRWNGSAWQLVDIHDLIAAKGDLLVGSAADTLSKLTVGSDGSFLRAKASETTGIEWQKNNHAATAAPTTGDDSGDGYSVGSRWIDTTNDKEYVCLDASVGAAVWTETTGAGAGGSTWTQIVDENGTSFANFTSLSGTWASNGTIIQQTATGLTIRRCRITARKPLSHFVASVEIRFPTGGDSVRSAGMLWNWVGTDTTGGVYVALVDDVTNTYQIGRDAASAPVNEATTVNLDTWYTILVRSSHNQVDLYIDASHVASASLTTAEDVRHFIGLRAGGGTVDFRNFKVWVPTLPS